MKGGVFLSKAEMGGGRGMVTAKCPLEKGWLWNFDSKGQERHYSVFESHLVCFELTLLLI